MPEPNAISPHRLGRYFLHTKIGAGGMAEIWLARQEGPAGFLKQLVVKKIHAHLANDRQFVNMFLNEARLAALLNHPNLVHIFELAEENGTYYLVMEHVPGKNLRAIQRRCIELDLKIPFGFIAHAIAGACAGLHYAHDVADSSGKPLNLVHRDISPDNIIVSYDGMPKVLDFGIAKATGVFAQTRSGVVKGKYAYMSPEHVLGHPLDRRADVYSLGVVMHELITGARPFQATSDVVLLRKIVEEESKPIEEIRPDIPPALAAIVRRALAKNKEDRYPDTRSLARDLEFFLRDKEPIGMTDIATFMERLFIKDQQVGIVIDPFLPQTPQQSSQSSDQTIAEGTTVVPDPTITELGSKRKWLIAIALFCLGAGLAVGFLTLTR